MEYGLLPSRMTFPRQCFTLMSNTLKDFKNAKKKDENYYFLHLEHFYPSLTDRKTDGNDTPLLSIPNTGVLKTLATTSYASLVYYV